MKNRELVFAEVLLGTSFCMVACEIPAKMANAHRERFRGHYEFKFADVWNDNGLNGQYSIADELIAQAVCSSFDNDVNSLLGFCRCRLNYRYPAKSNRKALIGTTPHFPWLRKVYCNCVEKYIQLEPRDIYKPVAEMLAYCTCTELPWWEIKDHLPEIRRTIDSRTWTLADAYEFLCVFPKTSLFTWGWFSASDEAEYARCIADSIKMILQSSSRQSWEEIMQRTRNIEAEARKKREIKSSWSPSEVRNKKFASWGRQDLLLINEMKYRDMTMGERENEGLPAEMLDRLYKLDVVRAYLYAE